MKRKPASCLTIAEAQAQAKERNEWLLARRGHALSQPALEDPRLRKPGDARPFDLKLIGREFSFRRLQRQTARVSSLDETNDRLKPERMRLHPTKGWRHGGVA